MHGVSHAPSPAEPALSKLPFVVPSPPSPLLLVPPLSAGLRVGIVIGAATSTPWRIGIKGKKAKEIRTGLAQSVRRRARVLETRVRTREAGGALSGSA